MNRAWLWWLLPAVAALALGSALAWDMLSRVRQLACVENYGMAVYQQLIASAALDGRYLQTIHTGYADHWMWSGHRSLWMLIVPHLYRLWPSAEAMVCLQAGIFALGTFPAFGLGWRSIGGGHPLGGPVGGAIGVAIYALYPASFAVARADYQELSFGIPFALLALHQSRRQSVVGFVLAGFLLCSAREEWVAMLPLLGLSFPGSLGARARWVGLGTAVAGAYAGLLWFLGRDFTGYDNQTVGQLAGMMELGVKWSREWGDVRKFYLGFFVPVQWLALLAPLTLLPALGALFIHLTAPAAGGVDAVWTGHIHHMAPVAAFAAAGAIDGVGVVSRLLGRLPRYALHARLLGLGALVALWAALGPLWMNATRVHPRIFPSFGANRPPVAPEWSLLAEIAQGATVATDRTGSLLVAGRRGAYTYDESMADKLRGRGLDAMDYVLLPVQDRGLAERVQSLGGTEVARAGRYALFAMP